MSTPEISLAEIVELAGVSKHTVAAWRRQHEDFPKSTGGPPRKPLFNRDEVMKWLRKTGRVAEAVPSPEDEEKPQVTAKKIHMLSGQFTTEELDALQATATLLGVGASELVRRACLEFINNLREAGEYERMLADYRQQVEAKIAAVGRVMGKE